MAGIWLNQFFRGIPMYLFPTGVVVMYFWKGYVLKPIISRLGDNVELFYNKYKRIMDLGAIFLLLLMVIIYCLNRTIPLLRDYELMQNGYYEEITGVVVSGTEFDVDSEITRDIIIEKHDGSGQIRITVYSALIEKGEIVKVHYLPNARVGEVVERLGNTDLEE